MNPWRHLKQTTSSWTHIQHFTVVINQARVK